MPREQMTWIPAERGPGRLRRRTCLRKCRAAALCGPWARETAHSHPDRVLLLARPSEKDLWRGRAVSLGLPDS